MIIVCPKYQKQGQVKGGDELVGRKIRCPGCSEIFVITNQENELTTPEKEVNATFDKSANTLNLQTDEQRIQNFINQLGDGNYDDRKMGVSDYFPYVKWRIRNTKLVAGRQKLG